MSQKAYDLGSPDKDSQSLGCDIRKNASILRKYESIFMGKKTKFKIILLKNRLYYVEPVGIVRTL